MYERIQGVSLPIYSMWVKCELMNNLLSDNSIKTQYEHL